MRQHKIVVLTLVLFFVSLLIFGSVSQAQGLSGKEIRRFGNGTARAIAWSPDGEQLVVGGSLGLWFFTLDLKPISHLDNNDDEITALAWSPDRKQIATAGHARTVQLWNLASGQFKTLKNPPSSASDCSNDSWNCHAWPGSFSFSPDGSQLAAASGAGTVDIWDTSTGNLVRSLKIGGLVYSVAWNPKDARIAAGGEADLRPLLQVWDAKLGKRLAAFPGTQYLSEAGFVSIVQWINGGAKVGALFQIDNRVATEWKPEPREVPSVFTSYIGGSTQDVLSFAPDGKVYAISRIDYSASIPGFTESSIGVCCRAPNGSTPASIGKTKALAWRPDGRYLAYIDGGGAVSVIDTTAMSEENPAWFQTVATLKDFESVAAAQGWNKDGHLEVRDEVWSSPSPGDWSLSALSIKDLLTGNTLREWTPLSPFTPLYWALSPDSGRLAMVWNYDEKVAVLAPMRKEDMVFQMVSFEPARAQPTPGGKTTEVASISGLYWSEDSSRIAAMNHAILNIWDARTGQRLFAIQAGKTEQLSWSPDGHYLVGGYCEYSDDQPPFVVDAVNGTVATTLEKVSGKDVCGPTWAPNSQNLALVSADSHVLIWSATSGKLLQTLPGHAVEWSHGGARLAIATESGAVQLYDTLTDRVVVTLKDGAAKTNNTAFSPDDRKIATADEDGSIRIWDVATGKLLTTLTGHKGAVQSVIWKPDGSQLLSYGDDGTLRLWSLNGS